MAVNFIALLDISKMNSALILLVNMAVLLNSQYSSALGISNEAIARDTRDTAQGSVNPEELIKCILEGACSEEIIKYKNAISDYLTIGCQARCEMCKTFGKNLAEDLRQNKEKDFKAILSLYEADKKFAAKDKRSTCC